MATSEWYCIVREADPNFWLILLTIIPIVYIVLKLAAQLLYFANNLCKGPPTLPIPVTGPIETSRGVESSNEIDP